MKYNFGRLLLSVDGKEECISSLFQDWQYSSIDDDKYLEKLFLHVDSFPITSCNCSNGWYLNKNDELQTVSYSEANKTLFCLKYSLPIKDLTVCINEQEKSIAKMGLQYGLMLALYKQCIGLHGVTLVCGNEVIILSAPSGTGKTTLSKLLEQYCDAIVINGDFALLSPTEDGVIYEPTPFCGSSARSLKHRLKVDRVVFLEQGKDNVLIDLSARETLTHFMSNAFVPDWDSSLEQTVIENIISAVSMLKINQYAFAPTKEAADSFLTKISNHDVLSS